MSRFVDVAETPKGDAPKGVWLCKSGIPPLLSYRAREFNNDTIKISML